MAEITASLVKELREKTNAGMMDCKRALTETGGDLQQAEDYLRKKGIAGASKKASRDANEGAVVAHIEVDERVGVLVEINCETDFVAKNENFQSFVAEVAAHAASSGAGSLEEMMASGRGDGSLEDFVKIKISELGENLVVRRFVRFDVAGCGIAASYIHMAGRVGVLVEVGCGKEETVSNERFREVVKDITLHIAAAAPAGLAREDIPADVVAKEKEIYAEQMQDKPANVIDRIVEGKLEKFFATTCLLEQGFIKDPDQSIRQLLENSGRELDDSLEIRRFARFALGETL